MQAQRHAEKDNAEPDGKCADVVVVGAGPAGLAAALDAKAEGAGSVIVLDRRPGYSRCRSVILDREVLMLLDEWGVCLDSATPVDTFSYVHGYGDRQYTDTVSFPKAGPRLRAGRGRIEPRPRDILFNRLPRAIQRISDLEGAMLAKARDEGIEVRFSALVSGTPVIEPDRVRLEHERGEGISAIDCRYLVIADGARSSLNRLLGNERIPCGLRSHDYTCTVLDCRRRDVLLFWVPNHPSGISEMTGIGNGSQYTLVSRLPREFVAAEPIDLQRSRLPAMISEAARSIGISGPIIDGPMQFSTAMDRLREVAFHPRVLCVGDAARKGDPGFGGNLNEAIRDGRRFGTYFSMASEPGADREQALQTFRDEVQGATSALHTGGALTNNLRNFFAFGDAAQAILPGPVRSVLHFDVGLMMKATGAFMRLFNASTRAGRDEY